MSFLPNLRDETISKQNMYGQEEEIRASLQAAASVCICYAVDTEATLMAKGVDCWNYVATPPRARIDYSLSLL
jgi:hypothetical protein